MRATYPIAIILIIFFINVKNNMYADNNQLNNQLSTTKTDANSPEHVSKLNIIILLHLYNFDLMDEFINRINAFITLNKSENFYIKINIPIDSRIQNFNKFIYSDENNVVPANEFYYKQCIEMAPYHPQLITYDNCQKLYKISNYLKEKLICDTEKVQIIFSENRGVDVGSFLLLLDQIIKQNIPHDYIVKLHTKTSRPWREKLLKILDCNMHDIASQQIECVYGCAFYLSTKNDRGIFLSVMKQVQQFLNYFNLPYVDGFHHCSGTMFIISNKITEFFKNYDRIALFNKFNIGFPKGNGPLLEHGLEVFLGYYGEHANLKTIHLSKQTRNDLTNLRAFLE